MTVGRSARRVLIVCAATAACGAIGAVPASAASTDSEGLLGLNHLVNGLTNTLAPALGAQPTTGATVQSHVVPASGGGSGTAQASTGASSSDTTITASAAPKSLGSVLEGLPILGPVVTPLVEDVPILGGKSSSAPTSSDPTSSNPTSTGSSPGIMHLTTPQDSAKGSTWTYSNTATGAAPVVKAPGNTSDNGNGYPGLPSLPDPSKIFPALVAAKAEVGAAAVALIILGGVAVAGAAGAAGAAGRRQFVGGPW